MNYWKKIGVDMKMASDLKLMHRAKSVARWAAHANGEVARVVDECRISAKVRHSAAMGQRW